MSTANRTIRPFKGLTALDNVLDTALLQFGPDRCPATKRIHVDLLAHEYMVRPVKLEWAPDDRSFTQFKAHIESGLRMAGIGAEAVELIAIAKSSYLKLADIVFRHRVSDLGSLERLIDITKGREGNRARALSAPFTGFELELALILAFHLKPAALKPFRKGTWLTRVQFGVETTLSQIVFSPIPLTPEIRHSLQISAKATRYVDLDGHDITRPATEQDEPKFYVDADFLAQLNARRNSLLSHAFQIQLALDFVSAIVREASVNHDSDAFTYEDVRTSVLGSVVRMLANASADEKQHDHILGQILNRPEAAIANLEHVFNVNKVFSDALKAEDE